MPRKQLGEALDALHDELGRAEGLDTDLEERLVQTVDEIRALLAAREPRTPIEALRRRILEAERDFEESHAGLSSLLGRVSDLLSRVGI